MSEKELIKELKKYGLYGEPETRRVIVVQGHYAPMFELALIKGKPNEVKLHINASGTEAIVPFDKLFEDISKLHKRFYHANQN